MWKSTPTDIFNIAGQQLKDGANVDHFKNFCNWIHDSHSPQSNVVVRFFRHVNVALTANFRNCRFFTGTDHVFNGHNLIVVNDKGVTYIGMVAGKPSHNGDFVFAVFENAFYSWQYVWMFLSYLDDAMHKPHFLGEMSRFVEKESYV